MEPFGTSGLRTNTRLVGRAAELRWLEQCLQEAITGRPRVALLVAGPGVGKTRLEMELCERARRAQVRVALGRADEHLSIPYALLAEALEPHLDSATVDAGDALGLTRRLLGIGEPAPLSRVEDETLAQAEHLRALRAVERVIFGLAAERPLLICLDDLHWSDLPSLELVLRLVHAATSRALSAPVPLMFLCASRPVEPGQAPTPLDRLRTEQICSVLELGGLSEADVEALMLDQSGVRPRPGLVEAVHRATLGNPLYVTEICHQLQSQGMLTRQADFATRAWPVDELKLPPTLFAALAARMKAVSPATHALLILAACVSDRFSLQDLARVSPLTQPELVQALEDAMRAGLLLADEREVRFAHPMLRHAFYQTPSELTRRQLHLDIARALIRSEASGDRPSPIEIASHLIRAGSLAERDEKVRRAILAGHQAFAAHSPLDASRFFAAALEGLGETAPAAEMGELHCVAGISHFRAGNAGAAVAQLERAVACFAKAGDAAGIARAELERARVQITLEPLPYGQLLDVKPLERALASLGLEEQQLRGRILALLSGVYWSARDSQRALECAREALAIGTEGDEPRLCSEASAALSVAHSQALELGAAITATEGAVSAARRAGDGWLESTALSRAPLVHFWSGHLEAAESVAIRCTALAEGVHDWAGISLALAARVAVNVARGEFDSAERVTAEVLRMAERSGYPWGAFNAVPALACGRLLRGDFAGAREAIAQLTRVKGVFAQPGPAIQLLGWVYGGLVDAWAGAVGEAEARLKAVGSVAPEEVPEMGAISGYCAAVEIAAALGESSKVTVPRQVLEKVRARGVAMSSGWVFLLPRVLGMAARLERDWDAAERFVQEAIEMATQTGARAELALSLVEAARLHRDRAAPGDADACLRLGSRALALARALEMHPLTLTATELVGSHFVPPVEPSSDVAARAPSTLRDLRVETTLRDPPSDMVILMTDMVGSTSRIERIGQAAALDVMKRHNAVLRHCLRRHHGAEIQHTGDGVLAFFLTGSAALLCAVDMQRSIEQENEGLHGEKIEVRIGISMGTVLYEEGRLFGAPVNAAARLCSNARGGQILVGDEVRQLAAGTGLSFRDLGAVRLAGFESQFRIHEIVW